MSASTNTRIGWASVTPALVWTLVFFAVPFVAMAVASLYPKGGDGLSLANYTQFFANPSYWRALTNSLEVTPIVTVSRSCSPIPSRGSWPSSCRSAGSGWR